MGIRRHKPEKIVTEVAAGWRPHSRPKPDEVGGSCSTGIECAKVQLSMTARKGATQ